MATEPDLAPRSVRQRVDDAIAVARAGGGDGLLIPALHALTDDLGHVPPEAVAALADRFNLSVADVHGVVTFYRDFTTTPGPRPRVRVCRSEACRAVGGEALLTAARERLGSDAVADVFCLGNCALGPSASVDGRVVGRATAERLESLAAAEAHR